MPLSDIAALLASQDRADQNYDEAYNRSVNAGTTLQRGVVQAAQLQIEQSREERQRLIKQQQDYAVMLKGARAKAEQLEKDKQATKEEKDAAKAEADLLKEKHDATKQDIKDVSSAQSDVQQSLGTAMDREVGLLGRKAASVVGEVAKKKEKGRSGRTASGRKSSKDYGNGQSTGEPVFPVDDENGQSTGDPVFKLPDEIDEGLAALERRQREADAVRGRSVPAHLDTYGLGNGAVSPSGATAEDVMTDDERAEVESIRVKSGLAALDRRQREADAVRGRGVPSILEGGTLNISQQKPQPPPVYGRTPEMDAWRDREGRADSLRSMREVPQGEDLVRADSPSILPQQDADSPMQRRLQEGVAKPQDEGMLNILRGFTPVADDARVLENKSRVYGDSPTDVELAIPGMLNTGVKVSLEEKGSPLLPVDDQPRGLSEAQITPPKSERSDAARLEQLARQASVPVQNLQRETLSVLRSDPKTAKLVDKFGELYSLGKIAEYESDLSQEKLDRDYKLFNMESAAAGAGRAEDGYRLEVWRAGLSAYFQNEGIKAQYANQLSANYRAELAAWAKLRAKSMNKGPGKKKIDESSKKNMQMFLSFWKSAEGDQMRAAQEAARLKADTVVTGTESSKNLQAGMDQIIASAEATEIQRLRAAARKKGIGPEAFAHVNDLLASGMRSDLAIRRGAEFVESYKAGRNTSPASSAFAPPGGRAQRALVEEVHNKAAARLEDATEDEIIAAVKSIKANNFEFYKAMKKAWLGSYPGDVTEMSTADAENMVRFIYQEAMKKEMLDGSVR